MKRFDIVFHDFNIFKKGVNFVETGKDDHEIIYVNPEKFPEEEYSFGLCGIQATTVISNVYMNLNTVCYMMSRLRTSIKTKPSHHYDLVRMWLDSETNKMTCCIGKHIFECTETNGSDFREWADIALQETFEDE